MATKKENNNQVRKIERERLTVTECLADEIQKEKEARSRNLELITKEEDALLIEKARIEERLAQLKERLARLAESKDNAVKDNNETLRGLMAYEQLNDSTLDLCAEFGSQRSDDTECEACEAVPKHIELQEAYKQKDYDRLIKSNADEKKGFSFKK